MRRLFTIGLLLCLNTATTLWCDSVFSSSYDFQTAVQSNTLQLENYSSLSPGTNLNNGQSVDGITYSKFNLTQGASNGYVTDIYNSFSGNSLGANHLTLGPTDQFFLGSEGVTIQFATPVSALGVFFNVSPNSGSYGFTTSTSSAFTSSAIYDENTFVFAGLVSSTAFTTATISSVGAQADYNVPGIVSVATPEPSSWLLCGLGIPALVLACRQKSYSFKTSK